LGRITPESSRQLFLQLQDKFNTCFSTLPNYERHQLSWFNEQLNTQYNNNPEELVNVIRDLYYRECVGQWDAISQQQSDESNRSDSVQMDITDDSEGNASEGHNDSEVEYISPLSPERSYESLYSFSLTLNKTIDEFTADLGVFYIMVSFLHTF